MFPKRPSKRAEQWRSWRRRRRRRFDDDDDDDENAARVLVYAAALASQQRRLVDAVAEHGGATESRIVIGQKGRESGTERERLGNVERKFFSPRRGEPSTKDTKRTSEKKYLEHSLVCC